jgi:hypothetical protein
MRRDVRMPRFVDASSARLPFCVIARPRRQRVCALRADAQPPFHEPQVAFTGLACRMDNAVACSIFVHALQPSANRTLARARCAVATIVLLAA